MKIYGFVLVLIILAVWQYTRMVEENGKLTKANATLTQAVEDGEREREHLKSIAALNAATVAKVSKEKNILNTYALNKAHELELLKNENAEIKKWAINYVPYLLASRLLDAPDSDNANGLYITADGVINTDAGTPIAVQNENLYNYTTELKAAVLSCNADKAGLINWYRESGIILQ